VGTPQVTLRCRRCGGWLSAPTPWSAATAWFACPHCLAPVPVVAPRDPAPLFGWEVYPHLYPPAVLPRAPGREWGPIVCAFLVAATILLGGMGVVLAREGAISLEPSRHALGGTVFVAEGGGAAPRPLPGAQVNATGENGFRASTLTGPDGRFGFASVPAGGITLNVSAPGFSPVVESLFFSPVYQSPGRSPEAVNIDMSTGPAGNATSLTDTPFPDLENLAASLFSATVLLGIGAVLAALGAFYAARRARPAVAVAGGAASALAPVPLYATNALAIVPWLGTVTLAAVAIGVAAAVVTLVPMALSAPPPTRE
jgi:hypothetical protein